MTKIVGLGAGGHAKVVLDILQHYDDFTVHGFLDADPHKQGSQILGVSVLGKDDLIDDLRKDGVTHFFVGLGSIGSTTVRQKLFEFGSDHGLEPINAIHPSATLASSVRLGRGVAIMAGAVINPDSQIGDNAIINTRSSVDHDCIVEDQVHIAPGVTLSGGVRVGKGAHIGTAATIIQGITIGEGAIIGAGALVVKDVEPYMKAVGVPARALSKVSR